MPTKHVMMLEYASQKNYFGGNTTLGVVATNGTFNKAQMNKVASMAHNGLGRTIRPAHSMVDGVPSLRWPPEGLRRTSASQAF